LGIQTDQYITHTALGHMEIVQRRDAATLLPVIQVHAAPDTEIHYSEWAAYNRVAVLPNVSTHLAVDDTYHFVDPTAGVHTHTHTKC